MIEKKRTWTTTTYRFISI